MAIVSSHPDPTPAEPTSISESVARSSDPFDSLQEVMECLRSYRKERAWERFHSPKNLAISIAIEASELLDHLQWKDDEEVLQLIVSKRAEIAAEVADVMFQLIQFSDVAEIDIQAALRAKLHQNAQKYPVELARGSNRKYTEYDVEPEVSASTRNRVE